MVKKGASQIKLNGWGVYYDEQLGEKQKFLLERSRSLPGRYSKEK